MLWLWQSEGASELTVDHTEGTDCRSRGLKVAACPASRGPSASAGCCPIIPARRRCAELLG